MNRRQFTFNLAALGLVPALPSSAFAAVARTTPVGLTAAQVTLRNWAELVARTQKTSSVSMLQRYLKVSVDQATSLQAHLLEKNIVASADALGVHRAVNPVSHNMMKSPAPTTTNKAQQVWEKLTEDQKADTIGENTVQPDEVNNRKSEGDLEIEPSDDDISQKAVGEPKRS